MKFETKAIYISELYTVQRKQNEKIQMNTKTKTKQPKSLQLL